MVRYGLDLASCKPGTFEVVDRFTLKGGEMTTVELSRTWAYVRTYMEVGEQAVPKYPPRDQSVSMQKSFFYWLPLFDWTEDGKKYREELGVMGWLLHLMFIPFTPLFIPPLIGHYIAMRLAPEPEWPAELDAESKSG